MADIPGIPYEPRKPSRKFIRGKPRTTSLAWVQHGPLVPWMHRYAQWLAEQPDAELSRTDGTSRRGLPNQTQRTSEARRISHRRITKYQVTLLEQREDFRAYFDKLRADLQFKARELMAQDLMDNVEARREALQVARGFVKDPETGEMVQKFPPDPKTVKGLTEWVPALAFPRKVEGESTAPKVVIHLGGKDARKMLGLDEPEDAEIQDVEFEVVETKQLTEGEEED